MWKVEYFSEEVVKGQILLQLTPCSSQCLGKLAKIVKSQGRVEEFGPYL